MHQLCFRLMAQLEAVEVAAPPGSTQQQSKASPARWVDPDEEESDRRRENAQAAQGMEEMLKKVTRDCVS